MSTSRLSVAQRVREAVANRPVGEPFTTADLLHCGTRTAIDQILSRLVRSGALKRVARGVFVRPAVNEYVGSVSPEPAQIAGAIARSRGETIKVHGAEAARRLRLSTQTPTQPTFWTSGPSRSVTIGNNTITFRHASAKKMALAGRPAGMALAALWYLGADSVSPDVIRKIKSSLSGTEFHALRSQTGAMPAWMSDAFVRFEQAELAEV